MKNKELGFDPDKVVSITTFSSYQTPASFNSDKIKLLEIPGVESATVTSDVPGNAIKSSINLNSQGKDFTFKSIKVDFDYFKTLDIKILKGREFSPAFVRDSSHSVILNQTALQLINLKDPIGKTVKLDDNISYKIVGVCADFLNNGFTESNPPIAFTMTKPGTGGTFRSTILLKAQTGQISETINNIKALWPSISPMDPQLRYSFLDTDYEKLFIQSELLSKLFKIVSYLSLFISLIGLFGLSSYILNQRKKELSIRKVIGASVYDIFLLVNNHYVKLILLSTLFACILSYFFVKNWLTNYAYQTNLNAGVFVFVAFIILFLTVLTITVQSYKTIMESPVKYLKSE